jgi:hypothetical protein
MTGVSIADRGDRCGMFAVPIRGIEHAHESVAI